MAAEARDVGAPSADLDGRGGAVELQTGNGEVLHQVDSWLALDRLDDRRFMVGLAVERRVRPDRARVGLSAAQPMKPSPGDGEARLMKLLIELLVVPGHRPKLYPAKTAAW